MKALETKVSRINSKTAVSKAYTVHDPILIFSDDDFRLQGFSGSGTITDPYLIEDFYIKASKGDLIVIANTESYFIIRNNILDGMNQAWGGILLYSTSGGRIEQNTVSGVTALGIGVYFSNATTIFNNVAYNNGLNGIRVEACLGINIIKSNSLYDNLDAAIWVGDSSNDNLIYHNRIFHNNIGIFLGRDDEKYDGSSNNLITKNAIFQNEYGIFLSYSGHNIIKNNTVSENKKYSIYIDDFSNNNSIVTNLFLDNGPHGTSQAFDSGLNNIFRGNYWSDWTTPDDDEDDIIDIPYHIDGIADNDDSNPRIFIMYDVLLQNNPKKFLRMVLLVIILFFLGLLILKQIISYKKMS